MSLPTKPNIYNQYNNSNQIKSTIGYEHSGNIYKNSNNQNETIGLNIYKNLNYNNKYENNANINSDAKNNLQLYNITKEREYNVHVNDINKKNLFQKSVFQRPDNYLFNDNVRDHSYPISDNSRNQMHLNDEYLSKINKNNNLEKESNIQKEKKTELRDINHPPITLNNTEVQISETNFNESERIRKDSSCNCPKCYRAFMITVKLLICIPFGIFIIALWILLVGLSKGGNGVGGHNSGLCFCCCCLTPLWKWIKSDKWCCKKD